MKKHIFRKITALNESAIQVKNYDSELLRKLENFNIRYKTDFEYDPKSKTVFNGTKTNIKEHAETIYKLGLYFKKLGYMPRLVESKAKSRFVHLIETELDKAEIILAAKDTLDSLQKMAETLARMQAEEILPLVDEIKANFGSQESQKFSDDAKEQLTLAFDAVRSCKDVLDTHVVKLEKLMNGEDVSDLALDDGLPEEPDMDNDDQQEALPAKDDNSKKIEKDLGLDKMFPEDDDQEQESAPLGRKKKFESRELKKKKYLK